MIGGGFACPVGLPGLALAFARMLARDALAVLWRLSVAALVLIGCAADLEAVDAEAEACGSDARTVVEWHASTTFTASERLELVGAAEAWTRASCVVAVRVTFDLAEKRNDFTCSILSGGVRTIERGGAPAGFVGWTSSDGTRINIEPADPQTFDFATSARHELGHALGLHHAPSPGPVMYSANIRGRNRLTRDDLDACRAVGAC